MSWRDRDYARGPVYRPVWSGGAGVLGGRSIVSLIIWANVIVFGLCTLTGGPGIDSSRLFRVMSLETPPVMHGQIWRLFTAQYLHWTFGHILMNMIGLHFLGRPLEREWGGRRFLAVYTIAGLIGNIFYVVLTLVGWLELEGIAAGASGCVLGLLGAAAVRYPHAEVWIYFLFPLKIRTVALVFGAWYVLNLYTRGDNAGGDACHLAGLLFGAWWAFHGERWWSKHGWRMPQRLHRVRQPDVASFQERMRQRRDDAETVDQILKKVYEGGIHSLSESEKKALHEATERQRAAESDRID